jgi:hypothetical protein
MENKMKNFITLLLIAVTFLSFSSCSLFKSKDKNSAPLNRMAGLVLTEFGKRLQAEGRPEKELSGFMQLENENDYLATPIGEVHFNGGHYTYFVNGRERDGDQTTNACGIWAVRRFLRHAHALGLWGIPEDAWYRLSDRQIRDLIAYNRWYLVNAAGITEAEVRGNETLDVGSIIGLQAYFGIPRAQCTILDTPTGRRIVFLDARPRAVAYMHGLDPVARGMNLGII